MAAVSLSPSPISFSAMSTRRVPLSSNPNVVNSPLRGAAALASLVAANKQRRSHASAQREDAYGQAPPAKRQMVDHGIRGAPKSPVRAKGAVAQRAPSRNHAAERVARSALHKPTEKDVDEIRKWQLNQRSRFPKFVFYFESIPDDQQARLARQVAQLGAREEKFFSINITHVVTTRPIPAEKSKDESAAPAEVETEQPQTINPSLLSRSTDVAGSSVSAKRRLFENAGARRMPMQVQEDHVRRPKPTRNVDVLHRARDMGKKIWSLEKMQKVLTALLEPDPYRSAAGLGLGSRSGSVANSVGVSRGAEDSALLQQLLNKERVSGPSDRDPTVSSRELIYFKGPYIYIYDIEEKQKPIMVREYTKVSDRKDGDWPQLRARGSGRCPFVEDTDVAERRIEKNRANQVAAKATIELPPKFHAPEVPQPKAVTGKRTLGEMEDGHNRRVANLRQAEIFDTSKAIREPTIDFQPQNAFTSRAKAGRFFHGEPVASGVQPSGVTSAIRSQMISSTTGTMGLKAGTSKAIHGLQRKVLQKSTSTAQDRSSQHVPEMGMDHPSFTRTASLGRATHRKLDMIEENRGVREDKHKRTMSVPVPKQKKRDAKPGYCENCEDKFEDFDDHIVSRKHRRFADDDGNWGSLDLLLDNLQRYPKFAELDEYE